MSDSEIEIVPEPQPGCSQAEVENVSEPQPGCSQAEIENVSEPQPGCSEDYPVSPVKKRKKTHMKKEEKEIVMNVYKTVRKANPDWYNGDCEKAAAKSVGVSDRTVRRIVQEYNKNSKTFSEPKTPTRTTILDSVDDFSLNAIRRIVHGFFFENEQPTVAKILLKVNEDQDLPNFKLTTFRKVIKKLNFVYAARSRNSMLLDRNEIILWRRRYLTEIKAYRKDGFNIYYMDETWVNSGKS